MPLPARSPPCAFRSGAVLGGLNGKPGVQLAQGDALNGEKLEASEVFQQFGFTSGVPAGSELIVLPLGGKTAHSVIIATENGAYRVQVGGGEVCVYNQWGAKITLKKEKIIEVDCDHFIVKAKEDMLMQTKSYTVQADAGVTYQTPGLAYGGPQAAAAPPGRTVARITGDMHLDGELTTTGDQTAGGHLHRTSYPPGRQRRHNQRAAITAFSSTHPLTSVNWPASMRLVLSAHGRFS